MSSTKTTIHPAGYKLLQETLPFVRLPDEAAPAQFQTLLAAHYPAQTRLKVEHALARVEFEIVSNYVLKRLMRHG